MTPGAGVGAADRAARLAAVVAGLGQAEWAADSARLAGGAVAPEAGPPTYRDLARAGLGLVTALADEGRWEDAAGQAGHLSQYFAAARGTLHAVPAEAFDGLHAAARARDADELEDFAGLLRELFP